MTTASLLSRRTQKPINLALLPRVLTVLEKGGVLVVDELDRSLHPILMDRLLEAFVHAPAGSQAQLLFSSQNPWPLQDGELMPKERIWLTERDAHGVSELYCVGDLQGANRLLRGRLDNAYLAGRLGAIPNIAELKLPWHRGEQD